MRANQKVHLIRKACIVLFREGKISFYDDENPHSLFFISIAPRLNWKRYLRTEDPGNLSMRKKLWTLSIENTSPTDIKRSFQWWSKDLYTRKDILLCCSHLLLKNHDFHFSFQCLRKYELQSLWNRKQTIMEIISKCYKYKHPYRCHFFEDFYMRERHFSFPLWQPLRQSGCIPAPWGRDGCPGNTPGQEVPWEQHRLSPSMGSSCFRLWSGLQGSTAVLRGEELEALLEHQIVVAGALSHLHWSDHLSFPRKSEVALSFRRDWERILCICFRCLKISLCFWRWIPGSFQRREQAGRQQLLPPASGCGP